MDEKTKGEIGRLSGTSHVVIIFNSWHPIGALGLQLRRVNRQVCVRVHLGEIEDTLDPKDAIVRDIELMRGGRAMARRGRVTHVVT